MDEYLQALSDYLLSYTELDQKQKRKRIFFPTLRELYWIRKKEQLTKRYDLFLESFKK